MYLHGLQKALNLHFLPLEMFPSNPTDLLSFVRTNIDFNAKVAFDFGYWSWL